MSPLRGIAYKIAAIFFFSIMAALIKASADDVPTGEAVFFRSFFALPVIVIWLLVQGKLRDGIRTQRPMFHLIRSLVGGAAMAFAFAALGMLPLPEVEVLGYLAVFLTVIFAAVILGERLRAFRLASVALGMIGVLIVLWPRLTLDDMNRTIQIGIACILISAALRALVVVHIRRMVSSESTSSIVFYFTMTTTVLSLFTMPFGWVWPDAATFTMLVFSGLLGGVAQILVTTSYKHAEVAVLAPFDYASILFSIVLGYVFFDEVPTIWVLSGAAVIISAGVLIVWRERQLGLERGKARPSISKEG